MLGQFLYRHNYIYYVFIIMYSKYLYFSEGERNSSIS